MIESLKKIKKKENPTPLKNMLQEDNIDINKINSNRFTCESTKASMKSPQNFTTSSKSHPDYILSEGSKIDSPIFKTNNDIKSVGSVTESTSLFSENVKALESMITEIKSRGFDRIRQELEDKMKEQKIIQNSISRLENSIRILKNHYKHCGQSNDLMIKENDKLFFVGERANRELYFLNKEIPDLKIEISGMNDEISLKNEELRYIRNDSIQLEKEILDIKEEIKRINKSNSDLKKEKESLKNGITLLKKHINTVKDKILKQEKNNKEFLNEVSILVEQSFSTSTSIRK